VNSWERVAAYCCCCCCCLVRTWWWSAIEKRKCSGCRTVNDFGREPPVARHYYPDWISVLPCCQPEHTQ
jgi:hypothetical protein